MTMSAVNTFRRAAWSGCLGAALWCAGGLTWAQTAIPFKRDSIGAGSEVSRFGLGMLVSIAALALVLFWLRRYVRQTLPGKDGASVLQVRESKRLGPRSLLHVVHFAGQQYLIGQSEQGLVCLASSPLAEGQGEAHAQT